MKTKLTPIAAAAAIVIAGAVAAPAFAQSAAAPAPAASAAKDDVQRVEVTGIRASLQQALTQKRNSDSLVEVITAEDVGKMPDKNVADSLQHLPGVYTATAGGTEGGFGENDRVALRGAPSALTLTTLNGHTVSSGDWYSLNIQSGGRSVSYSLLPSEIIGSVVVHKSSQADLVEGGAAGSVDIKTRRPLEDFSKPLTLSASAEAAYGSAKKTDPQISGLVAWQNDAKTLGVLAQVFSETRHIRRDGQEFLWWDTVEDLWGGNAAVMAAHPDLKGKFISGLTGSVLFEQERKRQGGLVDVEFKPMAGLTLDASAFYSTLKAKNENHNYMLDTFNPITSAGISPTYTISGNTVTSLSFPTACPATSLDPGCANTSSSVQDIAVRPDAQSNSQYYALDAKYVVNDALTLTGQAGYTTGYGRTKDIGFEIWSPYVGGGYTTHGLGSTADVSVPGSGTFAAGGVSSGVGGWASYTNATDKEDYVQADGEWRTGSETIHTVKFGARFADHRRYLESTPGTLSASGQMLANAPTDYTKFPSNFANDLPGGMLRDVWTLPGDSVNAWASKYISFGGETPQSEFQIKEPVSSLYGMASFESGNMRGNFGLRLVDTTEEVTNFALQTGGGYAPVKVKSNYFDALPSFNVALDLGKGLITRFDMSRTMSRPDFGQLGGLSLLDIQMTGSGGNPNLKPIRSSNVDWDVEYYFGANKKSMVSAGLYYMAFDSYVTYGSFQQTFYNQSAKAYTLYNMSAPTNTTAELKGLELNFIGDVGYGFGVQANYTYANGRETGKAPASACATTGDCNMVGTSKNAYNLGGFFENDLFSARVTYSYRSKYLNGLDRKSAIYQDGVGTVSASLNFNVTKNIQLTFEGKDLNNPLLKSYASTPDQPRAFYKNGAQYYAGVRANF